MVNLEQKYFNLEQKEKLFAHKVVVKIGSSSLVSEDGLRLDILDNLADQIAGLYSCGVQVAIVSSGAVALGRHILRENGFASADKSTAAMYGQCSLISHWQKTFDRLGVLCGQVLFNDNDLSSASRLREALKYGVVIINGNDSTSDGTDTETADNDNLAFLVGREIEAYALIILTNVDGVYGANGQVLSEIKNSNLNFSGKSDAGTGGMHSKVNALRRANQAGMQGVIAGANTANVVSRALQGENIGTRVYYQKEVNKI